MASLVIFSLLSLASTQQVGTIFQTEVHPPLTWQSCTTANGCTTHNANLTLDANWRWLHNLTGLLNCYTDGQWISTVCPDSTTCTNTCGFDGADYKSEHGVATSGDSVSMKYKNGPDYATYIGSRLFLLKDDSQYQTFNLLNQEISFDVDVSKLPCGIQGALYFVGMDADGGTARYPTNTAGAKYGTGYCDSTCPRYGKFVSGKANTDGWVTDIPDFYARDDADANTGYGAHGSCCAEVDVFNANAISTSMSAKTCESPVQTACVGDTCGAQGSTVLKDFGSCDPDGCDFNPYRLGNTSFYGPGMTVDTNKKFTVTTQFVTSDGTAQGTLSEIKRVYTQGGVKIPNPQSNIAGVSGNSITAGYCDAEKSVFGESYKFKLHGGFSTLTSALRNGMVLTLVLWNDKYKNMLWLDGTFPVNSTGSGTVRGTCKGDDASIQAIDFQDGPQAIVAFSKIRFGDIGSTA